MRHSGGNSTPEPSQPLLIGLVSDTHGLVRPGCADALRGVTLILHAGDVGGPAVLDELACIAPVRAVSGNIDPAGETGLVAAIDEEFDGVRVHVSHGHELIWPTPARLFRRYPADVIIYGHTHRPLIVRDGDRIVVNPGAAGPRRFRLTPSVARLTIHAGRAEAEIIPLR